MTRICFVSFIFFFLQTILLAAEKSDFADGNLGAIANLNQPVNAELFTSWSSHQYYLTSALLVFAAIVSILIAINVVYVMRMNAKISREMSVLVKKHEKEIEKTEHQCSLLINRYKENEKAFLDELSAVSQECKRECERIISDAEDSIKEMLDTTFRDTLARKNFNVLKSNLQEFNLDKNSVFANLTNLLYWRDNEVYDLLEKYMTHYWDDDDIRNLIYKMYKELSSVKS